MMIDSKLPWVGTTIFSQMSQLAAATGAINLSQGFPDFAPDARLLAALNSASQDGFHQYAPMMGMACLRQQIAQLTQRTTGREVCSDSEITVTSGATEALFVAIQALVRPGDEVIVFDPAYDSYQPAVELASGRTVHIQLQAPLFNVDWHRVEQQITNRTRVIIVNSPHNPTGMVFQAADWQALADLVQRHGLFCISDQVYEHMVFDEGYAGSALMVDALAARTMVVSSFGKTFHVTGWKLGYCIAPAALTCEFRKIHQYVTFSSFTPAQVAIAALLQSAPDLVTGLAGFYQQKRDYFAQQLAGSAWQLLPCRGTYFQVADYSAIADMPDIEFCHWLAQQHGVAAIPLSVFSRATVRASTAFSASGVSNHSLRQVVQPQAPSRLVRFCFAKQDSTLQAATARLRQVY